MLFQVQCTCIPKAEGIEMWLNSKTCSYGVYIVVVLNRGINQSTVRNPLTAITCEISMLGIETGVTWAAVVTLTRFCCNKVKASKS